MRIYRVTIVMDFYWNGDRCDPETDIVKVAASTVEKACVKAKSLVARKHHRLLPYKEQTIEDGERVTETYQYKNLTSVSCELIAESEV